MTRTPSESSGAVRLLWPVAFLLAAAACAAALAGGWLSSSREGLMGAAVAAAADLTLLLALAVLRRHQGRVAAMVAEGRAFSQRQAAENQRLAAENQQRAAEAGQAAAQAAAERQRLTTELQQRHAQTQQLSAELQQREDKERAARAAQSTALEEAIGHLASVQIPAVLTGAAAGPGVAGDGRAAALCDQVLGAVGRGAEDLRERLDDQLESSRLAVVALARRVQTSAHRIQEEATRMADRHPANADVLESSMRVDHAAAQQARHAQSVAVLCGEWPGQQWPEPLALVDVVRAASSRIVPYQRVAVSGDPDMAVAARFAEPLIHLVAELLANATQSSPPATQVQVTVRTVQRGAVIEVDDGGVGMDDHRLEQAREIASGHRVVGLADLGEISQTGLAVVGQYVSRHGFRADLMPSPYGGVRAVVLVPDAMVETLDPAGSASAARPRPVAEPTPLPVDGPDPAPVVSQSAGTGLPQRRSRRGGPSLVPAPGPEPVHALTVVPPASPTTPEQAGAWMGAFLGGAATGGDEDPGSDRSNP